MVAQKFLSRYPTADAIEATIIGTLAGRAAEEVFFGQPSSGAENDLASASSFLAAMVVSQGLGGGGLVHLAPSDEAASLLRHDFALRREVDARLARIYARALEIIRARKQAVEAVANALVARRLLTGAEIEDILARVTPRPKSGRRP